MTLDELKIAEDILDEEFGVSMITDKKLSTDLERAVIDFIDSADGGGFEIRTAKTAGGGGCDSCGGC